mmetsp:Transcript_32734/g.101338  ORF Transcript_32734/g.101338 Transcript_32734/m.101338 type:complete len:256 (+) Transcript_32734:1621-2388(+)
MDTVVASKHNGDLKPERGAYDALKSELFGLTCEIQPHPKDLHKSLCEERTIAHYISSSNLDSLPGELPKISAEILISFPGSDRPASIIVTTDAPPWVANPTPLSKLATNYGAASFTLRRILCCQTPLPPSGTVITTIASFVINEIRRISSSVFRIPMCLACHVTIPSELDLSATYKVTVHTNRESVSPPFPGAKNFLTSACRFPCGCSSKTCLWLRGEKMRFWRWHLRPFRFDIGSTIQRMKVTPKSRPEPLQLF